MKKTLYILVPIAFVLVLLFLLKQGGKQPENVSPQATTTQNNLQSPTGSSDSKSLGKYIPFSENSLSENDDKRRVLYFYANWCPTCRPQDIQLKTNESKLPDDVVVIRVNYNDSDTDSNEKELARKYAITYQHTFVEIDSQGKAVSTWVGDTPFELLLNYIETGQLQ